MQDRYEFLRTTDVDGHKVALIADKAILGESGVSSLRQAFAAHATPRVRAGVLTLNEAQLRERLPELERQGMANSAKAFTRAIECVQGGSKPAKVSAPAAGR